LKAQINFMDEMIIDNFAGGGGASTGIELALGRPVDVAINHDPDAILMHKTNHPHTQHLCESVWDVNPVELCAGRKVALAWFSPDCKHFSKAKGGKPVEKHIRGLAWVAVRWAATVQPRVIILENVEEFKTWGPIKDGYPDINQKGRTFNSFVNALRSHGYTVEWRELKACDYGTPTIRKRFFLIARCDGKPIVWPEPTHGEGLKPYRTAAEIIDWNIPCPSIFDTAAQIKEQYGVSSVRPLAENTLCRIARGIQKFVLDNPNPFIIQVNHTGAKHHYCNDINDPLTTVTAKHGYGIVSPVMTAIGQTGFSEDRSYGIEEPIRTIVSKAEQCIIAPTLIQYHSETAATEARGQSLDKPIMTLDSSPRYGLVTAFMSKYFAGGYTGAGNSPEDPLSTVTAFDHNSVVTSHMCVLRNHMDGKSWKEPMPTIMTSPGHFAEVRAFLVKYYGQGTGQDLNEPLDTVVSRDRFGIVTIHGTDYAIVDIGLRMLTPRELYNAQGFPPDYIIDRDYTGQAYSKSKQVARCGNSVPPPFAEALVRANLPELACRRKLDTMKQLEKEVAV
jgi:DNA (cytosine-5)-methyltransferase 1